LKAMGKGGGGWGGGVGGGGEEGGGGGWGRGVRGDRIGGTCILCKSSEAKGFEYSVGGRYKERKKTTGEVTLSFDDKTKASSRTR